MPTEISYSLPGLFDSCIEMDLAHLYRLKLFKGKHDEKRWEIISFVNLSNLDLTIHFKYLNLCPIVLSNV